MIATRVQYLVTRKQMLVLREALSQLKLKPDRDAFATTHMAHLRHDIRRFEAELRAYEKARLGLKPAAKKKTAKPVTTRVKLRRAG